MEKVEVIVDKNDVVIGAKPRAEISSDEIYRVAALWITNAKGEHLLARRALTKSHNPGKWGPGVAGTVEEGETYESNIVKEAQEELGLTGLAITRRHKTFTQGEHTYFCQWFSAVVDRPIEAFRPSPEEVAEIAWFPTERLREALLEAPENFLRSVAAQLETFTR